jgi:hypothetical protein
MLRKLGYALEGLPLAEEAHQLLANHGYTALVEQIQPILNAVRQAAQSKASVQSAAPMLPNSPFESSIPPQKLTIPQLRDSAATALKRGLWEAAETCLEKLLQQGEPVETVAPDLITALLNAHETLSPATVTRIETLLAQLTSTGHTAPAQDLRQKLTAKLTPSKTKKSKWKFW